MAPQSNGNFEAQLGKRIRIKEAKEYSSVEIKKAFVVEINTICIFRAFLSFTYKLQIKILLNNESRKAETI